MRSFFAAIVLILVAGSAHAQTQQTAPPKPSAASPQAPGVKPKPVVTTPVRPATQTPADTATAMAAAERTALQSDLAWLGLYNGVISGESSERLVTAVKAFQKDHGGKPTGVLNAQERGALGEAARKLQGNVGWKIVTDMVTGARLGLPGKLLTQQASDADGTRWNSATGTVQVQLARRKEAGATTAKIADQERREPAGRRIDYTAIKPDFVVLSGMQGLKKFYVRGQLKGDEVRILTILYDQAVEGTMAPVVIAMSSAFNAFPTGAQAAAPPPRKSVEYATGVVVSDSGVILTDRAAVDGCLSIVVAGYGNADRVAQDKAHDLALLKLYGAKGLTPLALNGTSANAAAVDLVGIADPQAQNGGAAVTKVAAQVAAGAGGEVALTPAPGPGFSGAPARGVDGSFAGIALLQPAVVAAAAAPTQAVLASADKVRAFLGAQGVTVSGGSTDAAASVVRVICVRK